MNRRTMIGAAMGAAMMPMAVRAQDEPSGDVERNKATVARYYAEIFTVGADLTALDTLLSPDYVGTNPDDAPGLDAEKARAVDTARQIDDAFTTFAWTIDDQIGVGDIVATRSHLEAITKAGKQGTVTGLEFTLLDTDGLIV